MYFLFITATLSVVSFALGRDPIIKIQSLEHCDVTGTKYPIEYIVEEIRDNDLAITGNVEISNEITDDFSYEIVMDKWISGEWHKNAYTREGLICEDGAKFAPKLWKRFEEELGVPGQCPIPPGKYEFTDFELNDDDMTIPGMLEGKLQLTLRLFTPDNENIFCQTGVAIVS